MHFITVVVIIVKPDEIKHFKYSPKIIKIHFHILIAVVSLLANGGLLLTTGHYLSIFCGIVKQDEINSLKHSPKINKNTIDHSD